MLSNFLFLQGEPKRVHSKGLFKLKLKRDGRRGGFEREVREWGTEEVAAWLDTLLLSEYQESFLSHDIRGAELLNLERRWVHSDYVHRLQLHKYLYNIYDNCISWLLFMSM